MAYSFAFESLGIISQAQHDQIVDYLEERKASMEPDVSNYAKGRLRAWFPRAWDLRDKRWTDEAVLPDHDRLWDWTQRKFQGVHVALVHTEVGIRFHRDDTYSTPVAFGANFGAPIRFSIRADNYWSTAPSVEVIIKPGELYKFVCKMPHQAEILGEGRWGMNAWIVKQQFRKGIAQ
jgi:hypothetical protein